MKNGFSLHEKKKTSPDYFTSFEGLIYDINMVSLWWEFLYVFELN